MGSSKKYVLTYCLIVPAPPQDYISSPQSSHPVSSNNYGDPDEDWVGEDSQDRNTSNIESTHQVDSVIDLWLRRSVNCAPQSTDHENETTAAQPQPPALVRSDAMYNLRSPATPPAPLPELSGSVSCGKDMLPWELRMTRDADYFYHNVETGEKTWDRPTVDNSPISKLIYAPKPLRSVSKSPITPSSITPPSTAAGERKTSHASSTVQSANGKQHKAKMPTCRAPYANRMDKDANVKLSKGITTDLGHLDLSPHPSKSLLSILMESEKENLPSSGVKTTGSRSSDWLSMD